MKSLIIALSFISLNAHSACLRNIVCTGDGVTVNVTDNKIIASRGGETLVNEALASVTCVEESGWRNIPSTYIHGLTSKKPKFNFEVHTLMGNASRNINSGFDTGKFSSGFFKIGPAIGGVKFKMTECKRNGAKI